MRRVDLRALSAWLIASDRVHIAGGETLDHVQRRMLIVLGVLHRRHRGHTVVLVSRDVVGRVLVCAALGIALGVLWRIPQDNAAISLFDHDGQTLTAVTINDIAHLAGGR